MARKTLTRAQELAQAIEAVGLQAQSIEHHLAVSVTEPDTGAHTTVWLPDEDFGDEAEYIWGPWNRFVAPGNLGFDRVADMVKASAVQW